MKKTVFALFAVLMFPGVGFAADATGAWKSAENNSLTGKPRTIVLSDDKISIDEVSQAITIKKEGDSYVVKTAGVKEPFCTVVLDGKDKARFTTQGFGEKVFVRTSTQEIDQIRATPSQLKSKADPF